MTKNKKPASFWKKLIGKNKSSISSLQSEPNLLYDSKKEFVVENKRSSGLFFYQFPPPSPKPSEQTAPPLPPPKDQDTQINKDIAEQKDTSTTIITTEQPNVTLAPYSNSNKQKDNESISSFIVVDKKQDEEILELQSIIENLKSELESEKATNQALQKQKQAVAKDLDYFEMSIDEMLAEKNNLAQQLEEEKIKSQQHLDDLNLLLQKMKTNADNAARELSLAKSELKDLQDTANKEHEAHLLEISEKEKTIRDLKSKLNKSQEQTDTLRGTIDQLIKSHAEESSRTATTKQETEVRPKTELKEPVVEVRKKASNIPLPHSHKKANSEIPRLDAFRTTPPNEDNNLDDQLLKLIKEKEKLQSSYSKLPLNGGGPKLRRRKDELESMLDQVDSQLSKVKQKIKKS